MSHIFVSYSKKDIDFARYLKQQLEMQGFAVWMDEKGIDPSDDWWETIEANVIGCDAFVVVMSPNGRQSRWVKRERLLAEEHNKPIFPVLLEGKVWSDLADIQSTDMQTGLKAEVPDALLKSLAEFVPQGEPKTSPDLTQQQKRTVRSLTRTVVVGSIVLFVLGGIVFLSASELVNQLNRAANVTPTPQELSLGQNRTRTLTTTVTLTPTHEPTQVASESGYFPITTANASRVEFGYSVPGICGDFNPDGTLLATTDGVYAVATGTRLFSIEGVPLFSPDGTAIASSEGRLYDVRTGTQRFTFQVSSIDRPLFSPDGTLLAVSNEGVYEIATGTQRFAIEGHGARFSPDGRLLASNDWLYQVATGDRIYSVEGDLPVFSPDSTLLATNSGVYETTTRTRLFSVEGTQRQFSPNGTLLAVGGDGVYDIASGIQLFPIAGALATFSSDGTLLAASEDGVYDVATGTKRFAFSGHTFVVPHFSSDGTLLIISGDAIYEAATGTRLRDVSDAWSLSPDGALLGSGLVAGLGSSACGLSGSASNPWPYRHGLIHSDLLINIRSSPRSDAPIVSTDFLLMAVFARTPDSAWFRIGEDMWVAASDVEILAMPDEVPIEIF